MFTVKYQSFQPCAQQPSEGPTHYDRVEQIQGPFELVSQEMKDGYIVVYAHRDACAPGVMFGPFVEPDTNSLAPVSSAPRPTVWVMNDHGATVAKYDL